jgi:hypothetical protein
VLTAHTTLRRQRRNIIDFMRSACSAARRNHPVSLDTPDRRLRESATQRCMRA